MAKWQCQPMKEAAGYGLSMKWRGENNQ